jgi:hypothetical protein
MAVRAFVPQAQDYLLHELRSHRFFDVFEYNGPLKLWGCFLCNHPDRATNFITVSGLVEKLDSFEFIEVNQ